MIRNFRQSIARAITVNEALTHRRSRRAGFKPPWQLNLQQLHIVMMALCVAAAIATWIYFWTDHGNTALLQQRLMGHVKLSTGQYAARNVNDLNKASWDNGLQVLAQLDAINTTAHRLEVALNTPQVGTLQTKLEKQVGTLKQLLHDRDILEQQADLFHATLYEPVYQENLKLTMDKVAALTQPEALPEGDTALPTAEQAEQNSAVLNSEAKNTVEATH